jgi:hypothetical protein
MRGKGHAVDPENMRHGFSLQQPLVDIADYRRARVSLIEGAPDRGSRRRTCPENYSSVNPTFRVT